MASSLSTPHIGLFPFMSKGHVIPLLHLSHLLLRREFTVTFITTPSNSPLIRQTLTGTNASIIELHFPQNVPKLAPGIESTDKLSSMALFLPFANATKLMQPEFDRVLHTLPKVTSIISDGFLGWTLESARKLGVPRYVSFGMSNFAMTFSQLMCRDCPHANLHSYAEPFCMPDFPWVEFTKNDFEYPFNDPEPKGPYFDFIVEQMTANMQSRGYVSNSFSELEPKYLDYWNKEFGPKAWCIRPLCLVKPPTVQPKQKPIWIQWLDEKLASGKFVLYVAFGTQAEICKEQLREIAEGLERSEMNFLWVVRSKGLDVLDGFKERVGDRGLVVNGWVDQVEILCHESVKGFMSHCGWNSVLESICASVPILAWPMMPEQHLNARMLVEDLGVGVRVLAKNGSVRGFVGSECIEKMVKELMEGEKGKEVRTRMKEMGEVGRKAMKEGGSSWRTLDLLIEDVQLVIDCICVFSLPPSVDIYIFIY